MPNGRSAAVRSHRRSTPRRSGRTALFILVPVLVAVAAGGGVYGYQNFLADRCSGDVTATIVAAPSTAPLLEELGKTWAATSPNVDGHCGKVTVTPADSNKVANALSGVWPSELGQQPDVWVPESSAWFRSAQTGDAEAILPDLQPSVARSPVVLAMPKAMAQALGWPSGKVDWSSVLDQAAVKGWNAYGKSWGEFKLGMTDPGQSTPGLLALSAIIDRDDDQDVSDTERQGLLKLKTVLEVKADDTGAIMDEFDSKGGQGGEGGLTYVSAFPALEQEVLAHNKAHPNSPLVAIYPKSNIEADNPYLVLDNADWVQKPKQAVARAFLRYVRTDGRAVFQNAGYRDANRKPGADFTQDNGVISTLTALPRGVLLTDAVNDTINTWTALTRLTNALFVLDVSGSMGAEVPGLGKSKLDLTKEAAKQALSVFQGKGNAGLWSFSSNKSGSKSYVENVPLGPLSDEMDGGTRESKLKSAIGELKAGGNTGMYEAVLAAYTAVQAKYVPDAANMVVLLTDGANDDQEKNLKLAQLLDKLKKGDPKRPVTIVTIALGQDANGKVLSQISSASTPNAPAPLVSRGSYDITPVMQKAIFGVR
ncbi:MAG: VWA domain-containing protein [Hamadaea sp.]|uniref:substrate-binding and VWA domain-containing protein n=1 Tax=Hamadaea sp. TaxID=2024425 RepID=UPI00182C67E3|nr:substrate-binding and VWA domain-containing protein [Hamadaea sp.]NUR74010.1 VWA domain-containing protein [Hamadaea sp.]NUT21191.1 VWA domain-containing protein [Hamadaea sp.]